VVGIAGGAEKRAYAVTELGYDACLDRRSENFAADLKAAAPDGVDGLFENAGGRIFEARLRRLNTFARVAICGLIASCEGGETTALPDLRLALVRRLRIEGFIVSDHLLWPRARRTDRVLRERQAEMAGKHLRGTGVRAQSLPRPSGGQEFRQATGPAALTRRAPSDIHGASFRRQR
jgi:NADPH-dependent curcumin reductase CurA